MGSPISHPVNSLTHAQTGQADEQKRLQRGFRDGDQARRNPANSSRRISITVSPQRANKK
jgi:hypothetical protein